MTAEANPGKNAVRLVASTAISTTAAGVVASSLQSPSSSSSNTANKKIVLYNPAIDYSAPLPQQINPDLIGAHPHVQQYINSNNAVACIGTGNYNNQVRQQNCNAPQTGNFVANAAQNLLSSSSSTIITQSNQQQQQPQRLTTAAASMPLKMNEQSLNSNNSNSFANHISNKNFLNDINKYNKISEQKIQLQQEQQSQKVGLSSNIKNTDTDVSKSRGLSSSINNLLISNNVIIPPTMTSTGATNNNNINAQWTQQQQSQRQNQLTQNNVHTTDAISTLWGCSSNISSSSSGCSSGGSNSSQPSLSPTSNTSLSRQEYHRNSKDSLWSLSQTSPISNFNINNLRDSHNYANNIGIGITNNTAESPTTSLASSTTSASSELTGLWSLNCPKNTIDNSYFAVNVDSPPAAEAASHVSKISNIWEIQNSDLTSKNSKNSGVQLNTSSNGLFNDLWSNINNTNINSNNSDVSSNTPSSTNCAEFNAQIWRNATATPIVKCLTMPTSSAVVASTPKQQQPPNMETTDTSASANASNSCMQLFSEDFLNYLNMFN